MKSTSTTSQDSRAEVRALWLKAKVFRFFAFCFALTGIVIFLVLYSLYFSGNIMEALSSPAILIMILVPFLPAIVLTWMTHRLEKKLYKIIEKNADGK